MHHRFAHIEKLLQLFACKRPRIVTFLGRTGGMDEISEAPNLIDHVFCNVLGRGIVSLFATRRCTEASASGELRGEAVRREAMRCAAMLCNAVSPAEAESPAPAGSPRTALLTSPQPHRTISSFSSRTPAAISTGRSRGCSP